MTDYEAIVFDCDGVLVELTADAVLEAAAARACETVGIDDPAEAFLRCAVDEDLDLLEAHHADRDVVVDDFWEAREQHAVERQCAAIRDGRKPIYDDVTVLRELPHRMGVVSNNQQATVEFALEHHGLTDHFEVVSGRDPTLDGARRRKPEPYYLERALDALGTRDALYVGDSPTDVAVAHRVGVDSAFLRREHRRDAALDREPTFDVPDLPSLADRVG